MIKIKTLCISLCLLTYQSAMAQDVERYERDTTEKVIVPKGSIQVLHLKKSYVLGDRLSFRSAQGSLFINQTLQTLFLVNSPIKTYRHLIHNFHSIEQGSTFLPMCLIVN